VAGARIERLLFVVSRGRRPLFESLRRTFNGDDTVQVVLDRRVAERRRRRPGRLRPERRRADRRAQRAIDRRIHARGYAVVGVPTAQRAPGAASDRSAR